MTGATSVRSVERTGLPDVVGRRACRRMRWSS